MHRSRCRSAPEEPERTVRAAFDDERLRLLALPHNPEPVLERVAVSVGKTPYVRFDLNDYSVPFGHVRRVLTVLADPHEMRIADGAEVLARHPHSYDRRAQIQVAVHIQALVDDKHAARQHSATERLFCVAISGVEELCDTIGQDAVTVLYPESEQIRPAPPLQSDPTQIRFPPERSDSHTDGPCAPCFG